MFWCKKVSQSEIDRKIRLEAQKLVKEWKATAESASALRVAEAARDYYEAKCIAYEYAIQAMGGK